MRIVLFIFTLFGASMLTGCGARPPSQTTLDLEQIQGRWVFQRGNRSVVKIIDGGRENVTYYHKGRMMSVHTASIEVMRSETGARLLKWSALQSIAGRKAREGADTSGEYMYNCDGDRLVEFQGVLGEMASTGGHPDALIWRRDGKLGPVAISPARAAKKKRAKKKKPRKPSKAAVALRNRERAMARREADLRASYRDLNAREDRLSQNRAVGGKGTPARAPTRDEIERREADRDDSERAAEVQEVDETPTESVGSRRSDADAKRVAPIKPKKAKTATPKKRAASSRNRAEKLRAPARER